MLKLGDWVDKHRLDEGNTWYIVYRYVLYLLAAISLMSSTWAIWLENYCYDDIYYYYWHYFSFLNSVVYLFLAVPGRLAFTWISLETRTEYTKTLDILFYFSQTLQFWFDFLTVFILYWEWQPPQDFTRNPPEYPSLGTSIKLLILFRTKRLLDEKEIKNST